MLNGRRAHFGDWPNVVHDVFLCLDFQHETDLSEGDYVREEFLAPRSYPHVTGRVMSVGRVSGHCASLPQSRYVIQEKRRKQVHGKNKIGKRASKLKETWGKERGRARLGENARREGRRENRYHGHVTDDLMGENLVFRVRPRVTGVGRGNAWRLTKVWSEGDIKSLLKLLPTFVSHQWEGVMLEC